MRQNLNSPPSCHLPWDMVYVGGEREGLRGEWGRVKYTNNGFILCCLNIMWVPLFIRSDGFWEVGMYPHLGNIYTV